MGHESCLISFWFVTKKTCFGSYNIPSCLQSPSFVQCVIECDVREGRWSCQLNEHHQSLWYELTMFLLSFYLKFEVFGILEVNIITSRVWNRQKLASCIYICRHSSIWQTCFLRTVLHIFNLIHSPTISTKDAPDATSPQVSSMALSRGWISCWAAHASMAFGSDTTTKRWLVRRIRGLFHWNCSTRGERYVEVWYVLIWYHVIWFLMIWYNMMWYDMMSFVHFIQQYCSCYVTVHIYTL